MAFKGGTSLSKVFRAINRFSEDIDITIDYRALAKHISDDFDPFKQGQSNNQIRKYGDRLKEGVKRYAADLIIPYIKAQKDLLPYGDDLTIEHSKDGENIWVHFPSVVEEQDEYLKSSVLIELGGRNTIDPNAVHTVKPDISEPLSDQPLEFPAANIVVLAPERTFWEKATLIHSECNRGTMKANVGRLSRHWYDLHLLNESEVGKLAINNTNLLNDVINYKKCFYRSGFANYDACANKGFKLIPKDTVLAELEKDYRNMQDMIYGEAPTFDAIISSLSQLEITLNS
ncbi:nucleotidyl transferase AbiEii/AbiGii toxin family protein [Pseudoteredinibacter isoporae]|nr:nucleotidyl transferase AbiEii/AbiGii toxin family protein [Pseudoteredinibacter isoporae]NIB23852.1 nucleotidyl transferase AbiEii/AbiGii toxin family protein [Pseudoteredinibacter isoporae]